MPAETPQTAPSPAPAASSYPPGGPRFLELITGLFAGLLIVSNVCSNRLITLGPLEFDAGTLMFPLTYIFGDILTEVYGFARSRRVIWTGFLALFLATLCIWLASLFPAPAGWDGAAAWDRALALTPRIALGSMCAYLAGEFVNSAALSRMKSRLLARTAGEGASGGGSSGGSGSSSSGMGRRFLLSTVVGQLADTLIFAFIAFAGVLDGRLFLVLIVSNYVYKVGFEIVLLPLTVHVVGKIKTAEGLDVSDQGVSLNPFGWKIDQPTKN